MINVEQIFQIKVTLFLIFVNFVYFVYEIKKVGFNPMVNGKESPSSLVKCGAGCGIIDLTTQKYRLFTSMFMHASLNHIASNMITLFIFGRALEIRFGSIRYLVIYFITGLIGNIVSSFIHPKTVSVGASGAIFGVVGSLIICALFTPHKTLVDFGYMVLTVGWNLYAGFSDSSIDMTAHISGLIAGILFALIFIILEGNFS